MSLPNFAILASVSLTLMVAAALPSRAATSTAAISVSVTVAPFCQVAVGTAPTGAEKRATTLAVTCEMSVPYTVTLDDKADAVAQSQLQAQTLTASNEEAPGRIAATVTY